MFEGKTILITGGTGSFGGAVTRHLLKLQPKQVRVVSRDEAKQDAMRLAFDDTRLSFYLGDVRDRRSLDAPMRGVDYVFHAAALKQVPACEIFPEQAVMTNVLGSQNVIDAAVDHGVARLVAISTDKAVYPVNAMGMSKAMMEKLVQARARALGAGGPVLACVRYGNVLNSRGSVVPVFVGQLRAGRPLTITVPGMTRFLLTLSDAIGLIQFALLHAAQGDTFIRKSPAATVIDTAAALQEIYGTSAPVQEIGVRPGEKFHETLCSFAEISGAEDLGDYYRLPMDARQSSFPPDLTGGDPDRAHGRDYTSDIAERLDVPGVRRLLLSVPEIAADVTAFKQIHRSAQS